MWTVLSKILRKVKSHKQDVLWCILTLICSEVLFKLKFPLNQDDLEKKCLSVQTDSYFPFPFIPIMIVSLFGLFRLCRSWWVVDVLNRSTCPVPPLSLPAAPSSPAVLLSPLKSDNLAWLKWRPWTQHGGIYLFVIKFYKDNVVGTLDRKASPHSVFEFTWSFLAESKASENNIFWIPPKLPHTSRPPPSLSTSGWSWAVWALCNNEHAVNTHFYQLLIQSSESVILRQGDIWTVRGFTPLLFLYKL